MLHSQILPADIHPIYTWAYPAESNRLADLSHVTADRGKIAWEQSTNTFWLLTSTNPPVWVNIITADAAATAAATPGTVVLRDQSGSFAAVNIAATNITAPTITGHLVGNADTASKLATAVTIGITGAVSGSAAFDGSGNISISTVTNGIILGTNTTGAYVATGAVSGLGLSGAATGEGSTFTVTSNATASNTPNTLVYRDGSGNFAANVITANQFNGPINGSVTGGSGNADKLTTARNIALSGDVVGNAYFDGSADITINTVIQSNSVVLGTDTTGDYIATITAGTGVTVSDSGRAAATPTISIGQDVATTASPTFAGLTVNSTIHGNAATADHSLLSDAATKLNTARLINGVSFDGTADASFYDIFTTGAASPGPQTFPSNSIRGFDAYSSTDFPSSYFSGLTISGGGGVRSGQLAMNWNSEEAAPTGIYFRTNDDTTDITAWSAWQRILTTGDTSGITGLIASNCVLKSGDTMTGSLTIQGALSATTKNFLIQHPTKADMTLRHGSLEGPENGVYIRGKTTTSIIELPEYWTKLVDPDSITVSLTAIGSPQDLIVAGIWDNKVFIINSADAGAVNCYYHIFAERVDVDKLQVEAPDRRA